VDILCKEGVLLHFEYLKVHFGIESKDTKWEIGEDKLTWVTLLYHCETEYVILDLYV